MSQLADQPRVLAVRLVFWLLLALIVVFFLNNLAVGTIIDMGPGDGIFPMILGMILGVVIGQLNLISIWAAIAKGPIIVRLPWAYLLVVFVWVSLVLGNRLMDDRITNEAIFTMGVLLTVGCTVAQMPLWIASRRFRWRLVPPAKTGGDSETSQFNLTHMFVGTFFLAVALGLCRRLFSLNAPGGIGLLDDLELYLGLSLMAIVNLVTVIPAMWAAFLLPVSAKTLLLGVVVVTGTTLIECLVLTMLLRSSPDAEDVFVFWCLNLTQVLTVYIVLRLLSRLGFRLVRLAIK